MEEKTWRGEVCCAGIILTGLIFKEIFLPKLKVGIKELERVVKMNVKLKNEMGVSPQDYWKNTHKALNRISERLVKLANKIGQLY